MKVLQVGLVGVDVGAEPAVLVLLEEEGEGREAERGAVPREDRPADFDLGSEVLGPMIAEHAVDAVAGRDQVVLREQRLRIADLGFEAELDSLSGSTALEDVEQAAAGDGPEPDAAAAQHLAVDAHLDRVPGVGASQDLVVGCPVLLAQVAHRLLREDDAEPEGVVGPVALVNGHLVAGIAALDEHREVEA